jgi:DNA-binding LytR/AlgR family response regulator
MSKLKIVIIEDEFFVAEHLGALVEETGFECAGIYHDGENFIDETDWEFDLAMVDIFLSTNFSGLNVAKKLKEKDKPFFFLTANQDMKTLQAAAQLSPKAYITKPFNKNDVIATLMKIKFELPKPIEIYGKFGKRVINPNEIVYIESDRSYIEINTTSEKIVQRKSLANLEKELPEFFTRVHRSYIINVNYIEEKTASVVIVNGCEIPISRNCKENLKGI